MTEAIARLARVVAAGVASTPPSSAASAFPTTLATRNSRSTRCAIRALPQRGLDDGTFRGDLTVEELLILLGPLLQAAARMTAEHQAGVDKAAALVTSVFLHGTQNHTEPAPRPRYRTEARRLTDADNGLPGPGQEFSVGPTNFHRDTPDLPSESA